MTCIVLQSFYGEKESWVLYSNLVLVACDCLFPVVPRVGLWSVAVALPGHTPLCSVYGQELFAVTTEHRPNNINIFLQF